EHVFRRVGRAGDRDAGRFVEGEAQRGRPRSHREAHRQGQEGGTLMNHVSVVSLALRGAFVALAAIGARRLLARRSAALRHFVALCAVVALALLPIVATLAPAIHLTHARVIPAGATSSADDPVAAHAAFEEAGARRSPSTAAIEPMSSSLSVERILAIVWALGGATLSLRWLLGVVRARGIASRAERASDRRLEAI